MIAKQARPKIFTVLIKQIKDNVDALTLNELCELSLILRQFGDSYEGIYELIEPFILSKINTLTEKDLLLSLQGFYNPDLSKRFKLLDALESIIIDQADTMTKESVNFLLDYYTQHRMGGRILIETLKASAD